MHFEMLDILRMCEILQCRVVAMVLLEMVDFILVFVIAVVSGSPAEIRQCESSADANCVFGERDGAAPIAVEVRDDAINRGVLVGFRDVFCRFVVEAVGFVDVLVRPFAAVGKVV
jgi:hypothetical protein